MAATGRQSDPSVTDALYEKPYSFDFYQAVRVLHWLNDHAPAEARAREGVRFAARLALETPASEIYDLQPGAPAQAGQPAKAPRMTVNFFGLTGPAGALPVHYTEILLERRFRYRDRTLQEFLDIFNHRLTALFYQSWAKYHVFVDWERQTREGFLHFLLDLIGLGTEGLRDRLAQKNLGISDQALAYYGGILGQRPHSAAGLAAIVSDYFGVPAEVEQFLGRWMQIAQSDCTQLGVTECGLGTGAMLGGAVWDQQSKFRIRLGPLTHREFRRFLPNAQGFIALARFGNFYAGPSLDFDVRLVIKREEVPFCVLGGRGDFAAHLGWSTWLRGTPRGPDPDDATFPVGKARRWRPDEQHLYGDDVAPAMAHRWRPPEAECVTH
jgi:type VI secretion system protein ImpH